MKKPYIIAEIAQAYEGSAKLVDLYVKSAIAAKADAIKFQIFYADELCLPDYQYYGLFKSLELPFDVWAKAIKQAHDAGLEFCCDALGIESFLKLHKLGIDGVKIHSTDINNTKLLKVVANSKKKVFLSTGGSTRQAIEFALDILNGCDVTLMHGFQAEPTLTKDNNLNRIRTFKDIFQKPVGFQDHTGYDDDLITYIPFIAMGLGATIIEKHIVVGRETKILNYVSALTPEEFTPWVKKVRRAYAALGKEEIALTKKELIYKSIVRRAVCSVGFVKKGQIIGEKDITLKRTSSDNVFFDVSEVLGKKTIKSIESNSAIKKGDIL
jgi:N,N'-diacetyllegionaminate synthase